MRRRVPYLKLDWNTDINIGCTTTEITIGEKSYTSPFCVPAVKEIYKTVQGE
jgi:hypothetical protein